MRFFLRLVFLSAILGCVFTTSFTVVYAGLSGGSVLVYINRFGEAWLDYAFVVIACFGGGFVALDYIRLLLEKEKVGSFFPSHDAELRRLESREEKQKVEEINRMLHMADEVGFLRAKAFFERRDKG